VGPFAGFRKRAFRTKCKNRVRALKDIGIRSYSYATIHVGLPVVVEGCFYWSVELYSGRLARS
jgi:hypothetical protein